MERDPASRVINMFAVLMFAVVGSSVALVVWMFWRVWLLVAAVIG